MKRWLLAAICLGITTASGQGQYLNIQHHFDFGKDRHYFTNTLEGLSFDHLGAWFGFIDVDHSSSLNGTGTREWEPGASLIYFEINRYFSLKALTGMQQLDLWDVTVQWNDSDAPFIPYAYLFGISRNNLLGSFMDAHVELLLRQERDNQLGWQLTGVWFKSGKIGNFDWQFLGYFDWWKNDLGRFFMAEPQLVVSVHSSGHFWLGTEWEINIGEDEAYNSVNPTLFLRYDF